MQLSLRRFSGNYETQSRTRIAKLVKTGRGKESFNDVALWLGIDLERAERARLIRLRAQSWLRRPDIRKRPVGDLLGGR